MLQPVPLLVALAVALAGPPAPAALAAPADSSVAPADSSAAPADSSAAPRLVTLETVRGLIVIALDESAAPRTAANFERLVTQGYFDGTCFHAVYPGYKIQAGDPNTREPDPATDGRGGPGYTLPPEFALPCVRGAVAAARLPDVANPGRESNGSQFFILLADDPALDRAGTTVFGHVVRGLDVADAIGRIGRLPDVPRGPGGPDPGRRALIGRAFLGPPAAPAPSASGAP